MIGIISRSISSNISYFFVLGTSFKILLLIKANIIFNGEKLKPFPLKSGIRQSAHPPHCYST
jgi:hypothetical protein